MNHATPQETQHGTLILLLELEPQLMLKLHHTQDMLSTEEENDQNKQVVFSSCDLQMQPKFVD